MARYSFYQWCEDYERQDLLGRWDYEATGFGPQDVTYASAKYAYFKCPKGIHESESRKICGITSTNTKLICKQCNAEMPYTLDDLTGKHFGQLEVLRYDRERSKQSKQTYWICKCSCGVEKSIGATALKSGLQITCGNRKIHWSGKNASNWKGGITAANISIRTSEDYGFWRKEVLEKDGYKCLVCGNTNHLEVHHIYPFAVYPHDRFSINNGCVLCYFHHSMYERGSFHYEYGTRDNTPEQLEEYINRKRKELGIFEPFNIYDYMSSIEDDNLDIDDSQLDLFELEE